MSIRCIFLKGYHAVPDQAYSRLIGFEPDATPQKLKIPNVVVPPPFNNQAQAQQNRNDGKLDRRDEAGDGSRNVCSDADADCNAVHDGQVFTSCSILDLALQSCINCL